MRSHKRQIVTGISILLFILLFNTSTIASSCTSLCTYNGCDVSFTQSSNSWSFTVDCGNYYGSLHGVGQFNGTICGGMTPCHPNIK